jgi:tripartite-type tricarboxylate transporter receptor subunit TctC
VFATIPAAHQFVSSGRLKALAVSSAKRSATLPDVPTVAENALPGFDVNSWLGLFMPTGSPRTAIARMNEAIEKTLQQQEVRDLLKVVGADPVGGPPERLGVHLQTELARWVKLARTVKFEVAN